jgi:hypothetical protein
MERSRESPDVLASQREAVEQLSAQLRDIVMPVKKGRAPSRKIMPLDDGTKVTIRGVPKRTSVPMVCSLCGSAVRGTVGIMQHQRGTRCQNGARLKALLAEGCLTFSQIGQRLGLTRERIRQIAKNMGFESGRERMSTCTLKKKLSRRQAAIQKRLADILAVCSEKGFVAAPFDLGREKAVMINGHLCHVEYHPVKREQPKRRSLYGRIVCPTGYDFAISKQSDDEYYIVPSDVFTRAAQKNKKGRTATHYLMFALTPVEEWYWSEFTLLKTPEDSLAAEIRKCKGAWHLLANPK